MLTVSRWTFISGKWCPRREWSSPPDARAASDAARRGVLYSSVFLGSPGESLTSNRLRFLSDCRHLLEDKKNRRKRNALFYRLRALLQPEYALRPYRKSTRKITIPLVHGITFAFSLLPPPLAPRILSRAPVEGPRREGERDRYTSSWQPPHSRLAAMATVGAGAAREQRPCAAVWRTAVRRGRCCRCALLSVYVEAREIPYKMIIVYR